MIRAILPPNVVAVDTVEDSLEGTLFPAEEQVISQAVDKRRREFTTARLCARRALRMLGKPEAPILPGLRGEPQWPVGVVGSITHCAGYRGAVLGDATLISSIGIDAEPDEELPYGVLDAIGLPSERAAVQTLLRRHPGVRWDRLLFCAKESVYKTWFPLTHRWLSFEHASVTIDPVRGTFTARLLVEAPVVYGQRLKSLTGHWLAADGLLITAIVLPTPVVPPAAPVQQRRADART
ncbi:4'-phosphopantetheinyl transferase family protein [Streptosporangium sp. NBC_01756]|uniref:4'-phosphopantetheinyl transferase family protein n=1 Tax=Streptosporangium sp. NBC_01756 TaxID=2975950 RepID=UPI002DD8579D|nr:4'-phosphopantetheinyl transferase superfamily protein [Streptosporangium sp. NBC_01756]WSC88639.1 4'-phosphopantetheinyl transferase superfamily protein [Streptosporangium sp. NBC_01756]